MKQLYYLLFFVGLFAYRPAFAQCNTSVNLALNRPGFSSSAQDGRYVASSALDGDATGSRWASASSDNEYIYVDLGAEYSLCQVHLIWENAYGKKYTIDFSDDGSSWNTVYTANNNTTLDNVIPVSGNARYVRMKGVQRATGFGYSIFEFQVYGTATQTAPVCATTNVALGKTAFTSSIENATLPAADAFDGSLATRWSSGSSDNNYLMVDLGQLYTICQVEIDWHGNAFAYNYTVDFSSDNNTWTTAYTVTANGAVVNAVPLSGNARYVRMTGVLRSNNGFGYSIEEMKVFGTVANILAVAPVLNFKATRQSGGAVLLQWATSTAGHEQFGVERSTDGVRYDQIGTVSAPVSAQSGTRYAFTDNAPPAATAFYRLSQQGSTGDGATRSDVVRVAAGNTPATEVTVYPNPVTDVLYVKSTGSDVIRSVKLYSVQGTAVKQLQNTAGNSTVSLPMSAVPAGMYVLQVSTGQETKVYKIVK